MSSMPITSRATGVPDPQRERFFNLLHQSLLDRSFVRLTLAKYRGDEADLERVLIRRVDVRGEDCLSFVYRYRTRDLTRNLPLQQAVAELQALLGNSFKAGHLSTQQQEAQLSFSKKGQAGLHVTSVAGSEEETSQTHNREKQRWVAQDRAFLVELGVTHAQHQVVPAMARKWKQINKFVEVFSHALSSSPLATARQIKVMDFGSGKGYLTFALHDYLSSLPDATPQVTGVELRDELVKLCNAAVSKLHLQGLSFECGDVRSHASSPIDVMIALHACDTATDHAIHTGIRSGAAIIMCSPCCHKQIRPQMKSPALLKPMLQHGIHLGQEAEMVTDGLRALLLEAQGYDTQVFEFISLEHTNKNKMILAVRRAQPLPAHRHHELLQQIAQIKAFYGIAEHCLESLLMGSTSTTVRVASHTTPSQTTLE